MASAAEWLNRLIGGSMRRNGIALVMALALLVTACSSGSSSGSSKDSGAASASASSSAKGRPAQRGYFVYWDQNEEQRFLASATQKRGQLIPPWDPNGQLCLLHDGSGRFVVGYNPTLPGQHNPGGKRPSKDPPVGEALYNRSGTFTGTVLFTPGRYKLKGQKRGTDIPPDPDAAFNSNGTMTGCAVDAKNNVLATDLGTAQGQYPSPDDGRLIEWFAPKYDTFCIVDGPTMGGDGPHHVDGHGGLRQPGTLAIAPNGDLLLPEAGYQATPAPSGRVLRISQASLPKAAADCGPDGLYPADRLQTSTFFQGSLQMLPFPLGIARDPTCECWAIASTIGDPAIAWVDDAGQLLANHPTIPGGSIANIGKDPNGYNPFGLAFAPDGTLYFVDIHIECKPGGSAAALDCGPASKGGRELKVTFTGGQPSAPTPIDSGLDFPTSVTVCVPSKGTVCPER